MKNPFRLALCAAALCAGTLINGTLAAETPPASDKAEALLKRFTLEEKIDYIAGINGFSIRAIPRLNIPEIKMADGPMGVRGNNSTSPSTGYPAGVGLAASWDRELATRIGEAMGRDCRSRGFHILLAPGVNINRSPLCGRNFEYLGEDPLLAGQTAAAFIQGLSNEGVMGCVKHFAANNQEWNRNGISSEVDERTLREIYLPAFEMAVKQGHVGAVMSAYNLLNGDHCTQNDWLQNQVLKHEWGFKGFVMSDWWATHDTKPTALNGLDLEMPNAKCFTKDVLLPLVRDGTIPEAIIDDKVRRILTSIIEAGFLDRPQLEKDIPGDDPKNDEVALEGARETAVLLKNEGTLLPLVLNARQTILVVGPNATPAVAGGAGSGHVAALHPVGMLDGIKAVASAATVITHPGLQLLPNTTDYIGADTLKTAADSADIIIACVGFGQADMTNSACYKYEAGWPDGKARGLGIVESENSDRPFQLPAAQVETLRRLAALHKKMVVVLNSGGGVDPAGWLDRIPALICAWYPGQEGGKAVAEIINGDVNPSGKLPVTFARRFEDYPCAPYYKIDDKGKTPYAEGVNVGYRGFDANKVDPLFCFGFGLSYTTFAYSGLKVNRVDSNHVDVTFYVTNTGTRPGTEVAEIYVAPAAAPVTRPPKELKGYDRVMLVPGETKSVDVTLDSRAFSYWDVRNHQWSMVPGHYGILVGASSRDIRLTGDVEQKQ